MSFYTLVNCMDGRVQRPALDYLTRRFHVVNIDNITDPGPNGILRHRDDSDAVDSILKRIDVSVRKHGSTGIAVVGHFDCTGNPGDKAHQNEDTSEAVRFLRERYPQLPVIGLWIDETWTVEEISVAP